MDKQKISVTVSPDLLKWLDSKINKKIFSSRSHGMDYCINFTKNKTKK